MDDQNNKLAQKPAQKSVLTDEDKRQLNLAIRRDKTDAMDPVVYEQMKLIAKDLVDSKALPSTFQNAYQVQMALMAGREIGMTQMESLNDLYFVNGTLQIYGKATPAALRRAGWQIKKFDESVENACTATIYNPKTGEEITDTFTFEDAELSGFTKDKSGWLKPAWWKGANRKRKLRYSALSQIIHTYVPEVLGSVAGIGDYSEDYVEAQENDAKFRKQCGEERKMEKLAELMEEEPVGKTDKLSSSENPNNSEKSTVKENLTAQAVDEELVEAEIVEEEEK